MVPALICGFCMQNSVFKTRITILYGSQTSTNVFCNQKCDFSARISILHVSLAPICGFVHSQQRNYDQN